MKQERSGSTRDVCLGMKFCTERKVYPELKVSALPHAQKTNLIISEIETLRQEVYGQASNDSDSSASLRTC